MVEEIKGGGGWVEGGPTEGMTGDQARAEIKAIEGDPSFAGDGKMDHWSRQKMLKRRTDLYRHALGSRANAPRDEMAETLTNQGVTKESLEADQERFEDRDAEEEKDKVMRTLTAYFGGEKETEAAIKSAQSVVKRFATKSDLAFLESSRLGNDAEMIETLAKIGQILERTWRKGKK